MKNFLLLCVFIFACGLARGQDQHQDVELKKFDEQKWKEIVGDVNFQEDAEKEPEPEEKKNEGDVSTSEPEFPFINPKILQIIFFVIVFLLFAFILYFVSRNTTLKERIGNIKIDPTAPIENIEELDVDTSLRDALASGDLRLAIRVHYLLLLKKLNEVGLIIWKKDKTNHDYLSELDGRNNCYDDVRALTLAYELVWYGERNVSSESFERLSISFESVNRQIAQP